MHIHKHPNPKQLFIQICDSCENRSRGTSHGSRLFNDCAKRVVRQKAKGLPGTRLTQNYEHWIDFTHLSINNDLYFIHGPVFGEDMVDLLFSGVQTQAEHAEASWRRRVLLLTGHGVYLFVGELNWLYSSQNYIFNLFKKNDNYIFLSSYNQYSLKCWGSIMKEIIKNTQKFW